MATFRDAPVTWDGSPRVHIVTNSVFERSAKFVRCGEKIGSSAQYDRGLEPNCPTCIDGILRDKEREVPWKT